MKIRPIIVIVSICVSLTSCTACETGASIDDSRYHFCVEHGGTFKASNEDASFSCTLPTHEK